MTKFALRVDWYRPAGVVDSETLPEVFVSFAAARHAAILRQIALDDAAEAAAVHVIDGCGVPVYSARGRDLAAEREDAADAGRRGARFARLP